MVRPSPPAQIRVLGMAHDPCRGARRGRVTGVGWEIGLLAGLAEAGVDLSGADLVVGTSAGSVVGAQLANQVPLEEQYAAEVTAGIAAFWG